MTFSGLFVFSGDVQLCHTIKYLAVQVLPDDEEDVLNLNWDITANDYKYVPFVMMCAPSKYFYVKALNA